MEQITKRFPGTLALDHVDFSIQRGEIHALLGENGAGKSTLMKILAGMYQATSGQIYIEDKQVSITSPKEALSYDIAMVYQQFTLSPELTVLENILLGTKIPFFIDHKVLEQKIRKVTDEYGLGLDLNAKVWQLSVGEQQRVEIAKCFYHGAKLLILDEPTSVLTPPEIQELFAMMKRAVKLGCSIVFITHKLNEVLEIADRITVFRKGKRTGSLGAKDATMASLSRLMVGRNVDLNAVGKSLAIGKVLLTVENVSADNDKGIEAVRQVSFELKEGEILGIAAVSGNGQAELSEVIVGLRKLKSGVVRLEDRVISGKSIHEIIESGVGCIPEKRLGLSLIPGFSIADNLISKDYQNPEYKSHGMRNKGAIKENAISLIESFDISTYGPDQPVRQLSGGNVQKVVLAREISRPHKVLLAVDPTYGLDVGAIEFVQKKLCEERDRGVGILLISEELDEVLRLSDRLLVMSKGRVAASFTKEDFDREKIGIIMTGGEVHESTN